MNDFYEKPVVQFKGAVQFEKYGVDTVAHCYALNHPRLGERYVTTSAVENISEDGSKFETQNTIYIRKE